MKIRSILAVLLLATVSAVIGCTDSGEAPLAPRAVDLARGGVPVATVVPVVKRRAPLATDLAVTARIGRQGGTIRLREAGLRVRIPPRALPVSRAGETVEITVTALEGDRVAYTFAPHGLRFRRPIVLVQDARVTTAPKKGGFGGVVGAYFASRDALSGGTATVTEFRPTTFERKKKRLVWTVEHFSGYLLASQ